MGGHTDGEVSTVLVDSLTTPPLPCWLWTQDSLGSSERIRALAVGRNPQSGGAGDEPQVRQAAAFLPRGRQFSSSGGQPGGGAYLPTPREPSAKTVPISSPLYPSAWHMIRAKEMLLKKNE